jgi:hypothetical protein
MKYQVLVRKWTYVGEGDPGRESYDYTLDCLFRPVKSLAAAKCYATKYKNYLNRYIRLKKYKLPAISWKREGSAILYTGIVNSIIYGISGRYRFEIFKIEEGRR